MMHLMHFGARCEGDFVIFDANNPPVINDENAPSVIVADARGSEAAKERKERRAKIVAAKERVALLERERDCAGLIDAIKERLAAEEVNMFDLIYEPFDLYTDVRKRNQIELIKGVIFQLKRNFNKEFKELEQYKMDRIFDIREKNT